MGYLEILGIPLLTCIHFTSISLTSGVFGIEAFRNVTEVKDMDFNTSRNFEELRAFSSSEEFGSDGGGLTVERRLYNSSVAVTVPFFSFRLPYLSGGNFIANEAIYGAFCFGVVAMVYVVSFIVTGTSPSEGRSFKRLTEKARHSNFNFLGPSLAQSFGMDGLQCIQKVICQCNRPKTCQKYGIISRMVQNMFPAEETIHDDENLSPFVHAATSGKYSSKNCEEQFDCILDPLGSVRYLAHWYGQNHKNWKPVTRLFGDNSLGNGTTQNEDN